MYLSYRVQSNDKPLQSGRPVLLRPGPNTFQPLVIGPDDILIVTARTARPGFPPLFTRYGAWGRAGWAMVSAAHEALLEVLRRDVTLWRQVLERALGGGLEHVSFADASSESLGAPVPVERRADLVLVVTARGKALVVVVEIQLRRDRVKPWVWPLYLAAARDRHHAPAVVVVVTFSAPVARWAAQPVLLGPGPNTFQPVVIGPDDIPSSRTRTRPPSSSCCRRWRTVVGGSGPASERPP